MTRSTAVLLSLTLFGSLLAALAFWGAARTHNAADFLVGSRRAGVLLTALGFSGAAVNASMLLIFAAAAFEWGVSAVWIWGAALFGYLINCFYIAPRLRVLSIAQGSLSLVQVLTADAGDRMQRLIVRCASFIAISLLLLQTGAQLHFVGAAFMQEFGFGSFATIIVATVVMVWCALLGGYWATSANDVVQGGLMLLVVLLLPLPAIAVVGSWSELQSGLAALGSETLDVFAGRSGVVAIAFAIGVMSLGMATTGQPHVVNRFMAARDEATLSKARWLSILWVAMLLGAALLCGWSAKVLYAGLSNPAQALFALSNRLLPTSAAAPFTLAILTAVVCSLGSQFLVAASSLTADLKRATSPLSLPWLRVGLAVFAVCAACFARYAPPAMLEYTLFSFTALGASFGPLLLVRLSGKRVRPGSTLGAMSAGFMLTLLFHLLPDAPGDFLERVLPFVAALGIALSGGERRRNPDRADRAQETVHDRVPI